ncbi:exodeoxyribonuclease III [Candidatus Liberibacter americanus]|uniref:Exonuclease III n=1 Tax=Candidatus Liberibacter americanus str. Sao Paulo TaxID=1261131 RepID=U6B5S7_9HYPH|nr:exodeoxyribonuclease III [Candidatus Liberibacter americanus]AHA28213.1 Exonuclease III [Candidatus Liberibacter americanus str. Sao Paulo]EMS36273.1 exodeoxyribonuclease III [Candidatus Liberibacter americanus PW_SP]
MLNIKIATWNVNSIRARIENVVTWIKDNNPDIICLQETKTEDINFPVEIIESLGYHVEIHGQKAYNGVAIISKFQPEEVIKRLPGDDLDNQARFIEATFSISGKILRIANIYLPNGNPISSPKYDYKLSWIKRLLQFASQRLELEEPFILIGDYNIIPHPRDCYDPNIWKNDACFSLEVRQYFQQLQNIGFIDAIRAISDEDNLYSFWDYHSGSWKKNKGVRIDHIMLSPEATSFLVSSLIDKTPRGCEKPSDHTPVIAYLELT